MRWIGSPDTYKGKVWRSVARAVDYTAAFATLEAAAATIKASDARPARKARQLEQLRNDWRALRRHQIFAETGVTAI